jgi:MFS family permease
MFFLFIHDFNFRKSDSILRHLSIFQRTKLSLFTQKSLMKSNQFALLKQRRFGPFFWTQFCGAANDNLFKFAFTVMVTYQLNVSWLPPSLAGLVIGALFIVPFLLFSASSGQLAEKLGHATLMQWVKNFEIGIMLLGAIGFATQQVVVLLVCTFLMGLHSTLFGPVKFAYLPQVLQPHEITGGNGMVKMGTFVAILLGNVTGGLLVAIPNLGHTQVWVACIALALVGRYASAQIPPVQAVNASRPINWNPFTETAHNLRLAYVNPLVFRTLLGISWMWFFGVVFLSQFPSFAKEVLHGDANVASLLLVIFSVGIGIGALLCERLSRQHIDIGLSPIGAIGMTLFSIDLALSASGLPVVDLMGAHEFIAQSQHWRIMVDLFLLSMSAGIYNVPMYALIQLESDPQECARIMAANNIINSLFMVISSVAAGLMLSQGFSIPDIIFWTGVTNAVFTLGIFVAEPRYLHQFAAWIRAI